MDKNLSDFKDDLIEAMQLPTKPYLPHYYNPDTIIANYKSAEWNREEVKKRNKRY